MKLSQKQKKRFKRFSAIVLLIAIIVGTTTSVYAANDPISVVNNLSNFIFSLIRAIGIITLGFGVLQFGLSMKSHDPSQRANSMLTIAENLLNLFFCF